MTKSNSKTTKKNTSAKALIEEILQKDKQSLRVRSSIRAGKDDCGSRICEHEHGEHQY
jgi:hypothetical protein